MTFRLQNRVKNRKKKWCVFSSSSALCRVAAASLHVFRSETWSPVCCILSGAIHKPPSLLKCCWYKSIVDILPESETERGREKGREREKSAAVRVFHGNHAWRTHTPNTKKTSPTESEEGNTPRTFSIPPNSRLGWLNLLQIYWKHAKTGCSGVSRLLTPASWS